MSEPLVIVGNGMAAARLVDELAKVALGRYAIAVIGDEPRLAYNRVLLSSVLAGETASQDIELRPATWWRDRGVTLKYGCVATEIDVGRRELKIENEESVPFSKLVLTTGSSPLRLNVPGADLAGVHTFRDIVLSDINHGTYKKLVIADGRLTGAVLIGDVGDALWYLELIRTRQPTARIRADMMFGRSLAIRSEAA
jgi:NAD(P)H-nitrite reductase large subunit